MKTRIVLFRWDINNGPCPEDTGEMINSSLKTLGGGWNIKTASSLYVVQDGSVIITVVVEHE